MVDGLRCERFVRLGTHPNIIRRITHCHHQDGNGKDYMYTVLPKARCPHIIRFMIVWLLLLNFLLQLPPFLWIVYFVI